jgi:hypothetical protein
MNKTQIFLALFVSMALYSGSTTKAIAGGYGQDSTCTGAYGQTTDCDAVKGATDSGKVIYAEDVELANTALDTPTLAVAITMVTSGVGAYILKKKIA